MQAQDTSATHLKSAEDQKYLKGDLGAGDGMKC